MLGLGKLGNIIDKKKSVETSSELDVNLTSNYFQYSSGLASTEFIVCRLVVYSPIDP